MRRKGYSQPYPYSELDAPSSGSENGNIGITKIFFMSFRRLFDLSEAKKFVPVYIWIRVWARFLWKAVQILPIYSSYIHSAKKRVEFLSFRVRKRINNFSSCVRPFLLHSIRTKDINLHWRMKKETIYRNMQDIKKNSDFLKYVVKLINI